MNKKHPNRKLKNFRLTNYTLDEIERLSRVHRTHMSALVDLAIAHYCNHCRKPGESDGTER